MRLSLMKYRRFGKTELNISLFSLGLMRCCHSPTQLLNTVNKAFSLGINHLETASSYGKSEQYLGIALKELNIPRRQIILTTKFLPNIDINSLQKALNSSLANLQVDYLDCVAIHGINTWHHLDLITKKNSIFSVLRQAQQEGKIKHIGFSTHGELDLIKETINTNLFSFVNLHYYYFRQRNASIIDFAREKDLGVFIISPADKGGLLHQPSAKLTEICQPFSPLFLTYRFLLSNPQISTLSMGASNPEELTKIAEIAQNDQPLSHQEKKIFQQIELTLKNTLKTDYCRQCYQCLPCPENVNIPEILRLRNLGVGLEMSDYAEYRYQMLENAGHWFWGNKGDKCTDCGDCLPRCPENLSIPDLLRDSHQRFKGLPRRRLWE